MKKDKSHLIDSINSISPSFCLAKWLQVTIDLVHGTTHSCHHPQRHKIPLSELKENPSALHNTEYKKIQRKMMLEGKRPKECSYCWNIEDISGDHSSDRLIKSTDSWAYPHLNKIADLPWDTNINPTYVEVMFGRECNLSCSYCMAEVSSSIVNEINKFGNYDLIGSSDNHRAHSLQASPNQKIYENAFWQWLPKIISGLKVLRVTGGEPLLNKNFNRLLEFLDENPAPELNLALNSNLIFIGSRINGVTEKVKRLVIENKISNFEIYTSVDSFGEQAEYIRYGFKNEQFFNNFETLCNQFPESSKVINCTYNILSIPGFRKLLEKCHQLKTKYKKVVLDISYLKNPEYLCANILTDDLYSFVKADLAFMVNNNETFSNFEISKFERLYQWLKEREENHLLEISRRNFFRFIQEYDKRKNLNFYQSFPELKKFHKSCGLIYWSQESAPVPDPLSY